jgi:hypothetical protein
VEFSALVATAIAFFMAVSVPDAFAGGALRTSSAADGMAAPSLRSSDETNTEGCSCTQYP